MVKTAKVSFNFEPMEKLQTNVYTISTQWHQANLLMLNVLGWDGVKQENPSRANTKRRIST